MEPPVVLLGVARNGGGTAHAHDEGDRHQDSMDAVAKEAGGRRSENRYKAPPTLPIEPIRTSEDLRATWQFGQ